MWGFLLYTGNIERLWRMMGIANQLLATIALAVGTTYLLLHSPRRVYALCTAIPLLFVVATVFTAGVESIQQWWQSLAGLQSRLTEATTAEMAKDLAREIFSVKLTCALAGFMLVLSGLIVIDAARRWVVILGGQSKAAVELAPAADSGGRT
jgi:carbon starvation protein CstA